MEAENKSKEKFYIALGLVLFFCFLALFIFSGDNFELLKSIVSGKLSNEEISDQFSIFDWHDYAIIIILAMLQVICAFLPAEPVQVLSGVAFGFPIGLLCCMFAVFLGNTVIFFFQKIFGDKLRSLFIKTLHLDLEKIARSSKCVLIIFILYFLPAIPYGMICFFAAGTGMRYRRYITVTLLGSLPSVCIGVGLGYLAIASGWVAAVCVFVVLLILLAVFGAKKELLFEKMNVFADKHKKAPIGAVKRTNGFVLGVLYYSMRFYYRLCGVRIKAVNKVGAPERPCVVLCNHGSFIDFIFAATLIRKFRPNFVVARLYFYDNVLGWLIRTIGGFPKSMFVLDAGSTKNCLRVLRNENLGFLAMMPEARLSTTGRFEDIQGSTYSFLKKAGVPIYTVKFNGDYFADPKWGKGFRRGALVEAEFDILYSADEVKSLSAEQIKQGVEQRLYYNEFQWLEKHPEIRYRSKKMAEGLENILTVCPECGQSYTITTKNKKVFCEKCGYLTSLDQRYAFTDGFRFKNLTEWYDWRKELLRKEILENEDYSLVSKVELRLPGNGRGLTRPSGEGTCILNRDGLTYRGTRDGEDFEISFPLSGIYRLLFGAGVNFEIYNGSEILFFVPEEKRSAADWYLASMILYDEFA
ncbi:MAG: hypothetical protein E7580_05735 [Ruminococcaceae bacterium]|nr:hypothetical protein [Oscillospiraceae bacterium]